MLIKEYRIPMPLTVEEYRIAQLYMVAKFSRERTSNGEGVEILKNEPYEDENGRGQFTHKIIRLGSHLPAWAKSWIPESMCVEEKAWNAYPYVKTEYLCPFFGERFSIVSETRYVDGSSEQQNIHNLSGDSLNQRQVELLNIATEPIDPRYYKKEEDPTIFTSEKTQRGPLQKDWTQTHEPLMCIYKLIYVKFQMWGVQTKVESWLDKSMVRDVLVLGHKQAFTWIDEWFNFTLEDIRKYEEETKEYLFKAFNEQQQQGSAPQGSPQMKEETPKETPQDSPKGSPLVIPSSGTLE